MAIDEAILGSIKRLRNRIGHALPGRTGPYENKNSL